MTYSIVARDPETGEMGVASQSHYFALGRVLPFAVAGVGVVATQSFVEPSYGPDGLALMQQGSSAREALDELLDDDDDHELRQVAMLDVNGVHAAYTGNRCVAHKGSAESDNVVVLGNMLASDAVLPSMLKVFETTSGHLAERMLAALDAAEAAGGDARGRMSAALVIVEGEIADRPWQKRVFDLRVDHHDQPLDELRRLVVLGRAHDVLGRSVFTPGLLSIDEPTTGDELALALESLTLAQSTIGEDPEPTLWKGVLLVRAGNIEAGRSCLKQAVAARASLEGFLHNLAEVGILPIDPRSISGLIDARDGHGDAHAAV